MIETEDITAINDYEYDLTGRLNVVKLGGVVVADYAASPQGCFELGKSPVRIHGLPRYE